MILIDDREGGALTGNPRGTLGTGSRDLLRILTSHRTRPEARIERLQAGDFCISGEGPHGPCLIGVERKTIRDMLGSIRTGRFSGEQVPKLQSYYEFPFLFVEGIYRTNWSTGVLEYPHGTHWQPVTLGTQPFLGLELDSFLNTISIRTGITVYRTQDPYHTCELALSLQHYFSKPWDKHHAHLSIHTPAPVATIGKASTVRRVAYCLQGIGWDRSGAVANSFRSVSAMCDAQPADWAKLPGFGKVLSQRVYDELHGVHDSGDGFE